ncbi:MAG: ThiF family adenylyltransferase [Chloroflexi bacterium]|nr:ThiF family adenylyltransferase [Chloroflexota bacterium]
MGSDLERYARQMILPFIGEDGQRRLLAGRVAVIGCGALGTVIANSLVRAGVGFTRIVDRDFVELNNLQRQILFDEADVEQRLPKAIAAARKLAVANSSVEIEPIVADANYANIEGFIRDVDVVLDGTDNFETRYLINDACVKLGKPWVYGGVLATYGLTMTIVPGVTPCLRCVFPEAPPPGTTPTCDTAGVLGMAVSVVASLQSAEALKLLVKSGEVNRGMLWVDVWESTFDRLSAVRPEQGCPACSEGRFDFLVGSAGAVATSLCGRNAIQITVPTTRKVSFPLLAERLQNAGKVSYNEFMLRLQVDGFEITVFPDARAIIKGTTDESVAKTMYAKYIGV